MFSRKTYWSAHAICLLFFSASVLAGEPSAQGQYLCEENYRCIFLPVILFIVICGTLVSILVIRRSLPETWSLADALSEDVELSAVTEVKETKDGIDTVTKTPLYDPGRQTCSGNRNESQLESTHCTDRNAGHFIYVYWFWVLNIT